MSTFISHTTAMLAAKFDPEPWTEFDGKMRHSHIEGVKYGPGVNPRPEFIPGGYVNQPFRLATDEQGREIWRHRPEPNPILVNLRADVMSGAALADVVWAYQAEDEDLFDNSWSEDFTVEQRDHARKVLAHLAHFTTTNR
jgi:hypothetical protein